VPRHSDYQTVVYTGEVKPQNSAEIVV